MSDYFTHNYINIFLVSLDSLPYHALVPGDFYISFQDLLHSQHHNLILLQGMSYKHTAIKLTGTDPVLTLPRAFSSKETFSSNIVIFLS
jgi:hypothetical protein